MTQQTAATAKIKFGGVFGAARLAALTDGFLGALVAASQEQVPAVTEPQDIFDASPEANGARIDIEPTGRVAELLAMDAPELPREQQANEIDTTPIRWADAFLVAELRRVRSQLRRIANPASSDDRVLSPAEFAAADVEQRAADIVASSLAGFSRQVATAGGRSRTVDYLFPLSNLLTPESRQRFIDLAFWD